MEPNLEIRGVQTDKNKFNFFINNYLRQEYLINYIQINWWFKNKRNKIYSHLKMINQWTIKPIYEFSAYYLEIDHEDLLWNKVKRMEDLRDIIGLEVFIHYQTANKKEIICQKLL